MSRSKHTEAAIIAALKQVEAGRKVEDIAREQGVSKHTVYAWRAKYGGMDVSEAALMRATDMLLLRAASALLSIFVTLAGYERLLA